jgi:phosphatidylglycerol---prolipoprotein diacylglyceryl transferase
MSPVEPTFFTLGPLPNINLGFMTVPTYFLTISLTTCFCILCFFNRSDKRNLPLDDARNLSLIILISGFIGARLTHILFEDPQYYLKNPMDIFYFWQGGFVFFGALVFSYFFSFLYLREKKLLFWIWHDTFAPIAAFGYALGRFSCFLVGCCYGKVCDLPWAYPMKQIHIASENVTTILRHPTQLYACVIELLILIFLLFYERRKHPVGGVFLLWLLLHSINRILMEHFRDDPRGPTLYGLSLSMVLSFCFLIISIILMIQRFKSAKK